MFLVRRLMQGILILWGTVTVVFFIFHALPSDPARLLLGQRSDLSTEMAIRKELGLDLPVWKQYLLYLNDLSFLGIGSKDETSHFYKAQSDMIFPFFTIHHTTVGLKKINFRTSYQNNKPVLAIIGEFFPATFWLALFSMLLASLLGIFLGTLAAYHKGSMLDKSILTLSIVGMSIPSFFAALLMTYIFAFLLGHITGLPMFGSLYEIDLETGKTYIAWSHLILPTLTLAIRPLAIFTSLTRNAVLDQLSMEYVLFARAKGLSERHVLFRHILKNALNPILTNVTGWFASLLAGAIFVEYVFDYKGIGFLIVQSLEKYDLPVLMGCLVFVSFLMILINIMMDILYHLLDPRIQLQ